MLIDPTTYVPSVVSYELKLWDWRTSQPLLSRGWLEGNPHYTRSGLPNDVPLSYREGKAVVRRQALATLERSALSNMASAIGERALAARFPQHRTLVRRLAWTGRVALGGYFTYIESAAHARQARRNQQLARTLE